MPKMKEMELVRIIMNKHTDIQTIILKESAGQRFLSIGIGNPEVNAIKIQLAGIKPPRPLTHDLLKNVISLFKARINKVFITRLENSTYYAEIELISNDGSTTRIDARPSDSIALALRSQAPIYSNEDLLQEIEGSSIK